MCRGGAWGLRPDVKKEQSKEAVRDIFSCAASFSFQFEFSESRKSKRKYLGPFHFEEFSFGSACTQLIKIVHFATLVLGMTMRN